MQCDNMHVESNGVTGVQVEYLNHTEIPTKRLITVTEGSFTGSSCDELQMSFFSVPSGSNLKFTDLHNCLGKINGNHTMSAANNS